MSAKYWVWAVGRIGDQKLAVILLDGVVQKFHFKLTHAKFKVFTSKWRYHIGSWVYEFKVQEMSLGFGDSI